MEDLQKKGLAVESDGAIVVFVEGTEAPFIIRKRDGAFTYATTDLATIQYRAESWKPDQVLYVVDSRQGDHFKQLFEGRLTVQGQAPYRRSAGGVKTGPSP